MASSKFDNPGLLSADRESNHYVSIFWIILTSALLLRLWGIWNVTTTDEYNEVIEALRVCSGHLNYERWFKRCYLYILAVQYGIYYAVGWILNIFGSPLDFAARIARNMEPLFIIGRLTSVIFGGLSVGILYRIGEKFFNRRVGLIASLLLMFTVFHVYLSQQAKVDALLGLMVVATFFFILKILDSDEFQRWDFASCGFLMALAVQTKVNAVVLVVPFAIAIFKSPGTIPQAFKTTTKSFVPAFIIGFVLGNPPVILAPHKFIGSFLGLGKMYTTAINVVANDFIGFFAYPLYFYRAMGPVVSIFSIFGIAYAMWNLNRKRIAILAFLASFYILMGSTRMMVADYYIIPAVPFLYLLIAEFVDAIDLRVSSRYFSKGVRRMFVVAILFAAVLIWPLSRVGIHLYSLSGKNTRYLAQEWIESNIPYGVKILMDSGKSLNSFAPPIAENRESLERILASAKANVAMDKVVHGMVDKNALIYYELLLKSVPQQSYEITSTMFGMNLKPIDFYIQNGYQYFIISSSIKRDRITEFSARQYPEAANFYSSLDAHPAIKLIKVITPSFRNRGDTFYVYALNNFTAKNSKKDKN